MSHFFSVLAISDQLMCTTQILSIQGSQSNSICRYKQLLDKIDALHFVLWHLSQSFSRFTANYDREQIDERPVDSLDRIDFDRLIEVCQQVLEGKVMSPQQNKCFHNLSKSTHNMAIYVAWSNDEWKLVHMQEPSSIISYFLSTRYVSQTRSVYIAPISIKSKDMIKDIFL